MEVPLSPLAHQIISAGEYAALVAPSVTPEGARKLLAPATPDQLLTVPIRSYPHAFAMLAGLWLWHDGLGESHEIAQQSPEKLHASARNSQDKGSLRDATDTLSFWHAIMHRREGDFWNSKYWYARCRNHPALAEIAAQASSIIQDLDDRALAGKLSRGGWNPDAFVDWVEAVSAGSNASARDLAVRLQRLEWHALFDHCTRMAAAD